MNVKQNPSAANEGSADHDGCRREKVSQEARDMDESVSQSRLTIAGCAR
jgi:hypothetical protein